MGNDPKASDGAHDAFTAAFSAAFAHPPTVLMLAAVPGCSLCERCVLVQELYAEVMVRAGAEAVRRGDGGNGCVSLVARR